MNDDFYDEDFKLVINQNALLKEKFKFLVQMKTNSITYMKLCSTKLSDLGFFTLAEELDFISAKKHDYEVFLLEKLGIENDSQFIMNLVISRALDDVELDNKISALLFQKDKQKIYDMLSEIKVEEEEKMRSFGHMKKLISYEMETV